MNIRNWDDIKDQFNNSAIILGNGASIAFDTRFNYISLFEVARSEQFINPDVQNVFDQFETQDFELILLQLWQASQVNRALEINSDN